MTTDPPPLLLSNMVHEGTHRSCCPSPVAALRQRRAAPDVFACITGESVGGGTGRRSRIGMGRPHPGMGSSRNGTPPTQHRRGQEGTPPTQGSEGASPCSRDGTAGRAADGVVAGDSCSSTCSASRRRSPSRASLPPQGAIPYRYAASSPRWGAGGVPLSPRRHSIASNMLACAPPQPSMRWRRPGVVQSYIVI